MNNDILIKKPCVVLSSLVNHRFDAIGAETVTKINKRELNPYIGTGSAMRGCLDGPKLD